MHPSLQCLALLWSLCVLFWRYLPPRAMQNWVMKNRGRKRRLGYTLSYDSQANLERWREGIQEFHVPGTWDKSVSELYNPPVNSGRHSMLHIYDVRAQGLQGGHDFPSLLLFHDCITEGRVYGAFTACSLLHPVGPMRCTVVNHECYGLPNNIKNKYFRELILTWDLWALWQKIRDGNYDE